MSFLIDTNVLSEMTRPEPNGKVVSWLADQPEETLFLSVITLGEISEGVLQLPSGTRRKGLLDWIREEIQERFEGRILPVDDRIILRWAALRVQGKEAGRPLPVMDGLIAATADVHALTIASRNGSDFEGSGVPVLNPWN